MCDPWASCFSFSGYLFQPSLYSKALILGLTWWGVWGDHSPWRGNFFREPEMLGELRFRGGQ